MSLLRRDFLRRAEKNKAEIMTVMTKRDEKNIMGENFESQEYEWLMFFVCEEMVTEMMTVRTKREEKIIMGENFESLE